MILICPDAVRHWVEQLFHGPSAGIEPVVADFIEERDPISDFYAEREADFTRLRLPGYWLMDFFRATHYYKPDLPLMFNSLSMNWVTLAGRFPIAAVAMMECPSDDCTRPIYRHTGEDKWMCAHHWAFHPDHVPSPEPLLFTQVNDPTRFDPPPPAAGELMPPEPVAMTPMFGQLDELTARFYIGGGLWLSAQVLRASGLKISDLRRTGKEGHDLVRLLQKGIR